MVALVVTAILTATVPLILGWQRSSGEPGTTADTDFYLLIQNSIMQLLGIFTAIYPLRRGLKATAFRWAQFFAVCGVACAFGSVPMYLYLPTMWSSLVSFFGAVGQAMTTLELALIVDAQRAEKGKIS
jgi:hypothetical protein